MRVFSCFGICIILFNCAFAGKNNSGDISLQPIQSTAREIECPNAKFSREQIGAAVVKACEALLSGKSGEKVNGYPMPHGVKTYRFPILANGEIYTPQSTLPDEFVITGYDGNNCFFLSIMYYKIVPVKNPKPNHHRPGILDTGTVKWFQC
ncbi:hypothetical protein K3495_g11369 [Podosphaera aphanis]|nr:hypothetical protein K3495_g11369 [Podosphaera aphanis]